MIHTVSGLGFLFLVALACSPDSKPQDAWTLVLKSGKAIDVSSLECDGEWIHCEISSERVTIPRHSIRAIEGSGEGADPSILWRDLPPQELGDDGFLRVSEGEESSLDLAVTLYVQPETERRVYLVGAVHIGEREYFGALQSILDSMDLVLWEGVGGSEKPSAEALERFDVIFKAQVLMKNLLALEFQLDEIDYERSFWRNSDLSLDEVQRLLEEKGLSLLPNEKLLRGLFGTLFAFIDPEDIPRNETLGRTYRAAVAPVMAELEDPSAFFEKAGASGMQDVVLDARNRAVLEDLRQVLEDSSASTRRGPQRIAIFYGAAHLPGMQKALLDDFGLRLVATHWIPAWRF